MSEIPKKLEIMEEVAIYCVGNSERATLKTAAEEGWKECKICHHHICPLCIEQFHKYQHDSCPGGVILQKPHKMDLEDIIPQEILYFSLKNTIAPITSLSKRSLVYKLIYEPLNPYKQNLPTLQLLLESLQADISLPKEEVWKKYGTVLVKRRKGKFIAWEPVGKII